MSTPQPTLALPSAATTTKTAASQFSMLIYGQPKIGKSTFASELPGAIFVATERGLDHLTCFRIPADRPCVTSWDEFQRALALIAAGGHDFRSIVIDTIDNAYDLCRAHVLAKAKVEHESDLAFGKGFALVNNEFTRVFNKLASMPYGLCLVSHAKTIEEESKAGKKTKTVPTLTGKARDYILGLVDIVLFADIVTERGAAQKRVIRTKPTEAYEAGDRTGRLPETMDMDAKVFLGSFKEAKQ